MKKIWIAAALLSCCLLSGCSPMVKEGAPRTEAVVGDSAHYPVTVETLNSHGEMREETFKKPPKRVVCIWQNSIENLLALGVGDRIVAAIAPGSSSKIQVHTIDYEYQDILNLGKIFDREEKAQELVSKMQDEIERAEGKAQNMGHHPRGLIIEYLGKDITVYGERSLAGNILTSMGGELLGVGMRTISKEQLIEMDPEVLFMVVCENAYDQMDQIVERLYQDQALQGLRCVKERRIYPLPLYAIHSAGVRTYDGIQIIGKGLYPEE